MDSKFGQEEYDNDIEWERSDINHASRLWGQYTERLTKKETSQPVGKIYRER